MKEFIFTPLADRLAGMPPAISGSGGRKALYLACMVPYGYGLSEDEAIEEVKKHYAPKCLPLFSDRALALTVKAASRCGIATDFYLPRVKKDEEKSKTTSSTSKAPASLPKAPAARTGYDAATIAERAAVQVSWRKLRPLTLLERGKLAYLRNLPLAAVDIACQNRRVAMDDSRPDCYVLTDSRGGFRQYRRWDGQPFRHGGKSDNLKGSLAKGFLTLGNRKLDPADLVFIVEGAIGLLELVAIQWLCAPYARRWYMVAAHSAASTFAADPELLAAIAGHHVRIMPDPNETGEKAARAWRDELRAVGCTVDRSRMPEGFQDLRVILAAGSDGIAAAESILAYPTPSKSGGAN
jgi:hypothetical protein